MSGGYNFGLCCPGKGEVWLSWDVRRDGGVSFSISSVGWVRIFSEMTHLQINRCKMSKQKSGTMELYIPYYINFQYHCQNEY